MLDGGTVDSKLRIYLKCLSIDNLLTLTLRALKNELDLYRSAAKAWWHGSLGGRRKEGTQRTGALGGKAGRIRIRSRIRSRFRSRSRIRATASGQRPQSRLVSQWGES